MGSAAFAAVLLSLSAGLGAVGERAAAPVDFAADVRPILNAHCVACHGGVRANGGLNLIDPDSALAVVEPGEPEFSYLLDRVRDPDDATRMPPPDHGPRLSDGELETLTRWVADGANWGRHWAFDPPARHAAPGVSDPAWCRGPVDRFVLAKLDAAGLKPRTRRPPRTGGCGGRASTSPACRRRWRSGRPF